MIRKTLLFAPPLIRRAPLTCLGIRGLKLTAGDLKKGDWLYHDNKAMILTNVTSSCSGRGARHFLLSLKCVITGNAIAVKPVGNEAFEKLELYDKTYQYLYHDETTLFLSDPKTFEQLEVSLSLLDPAMLKYLESGTPLRVRLRDEQTPVQVILANRNAPATVKAVLGSKDAASKL